MKLFFTVYISPPGEELTALMLRVTGLHRSNENKICIWCYIGFVNFNFKGHPQTIKKESLKRVVLNYENLAIFKILK